MDGKGLREINEQRYLLSGPSCDNLMFLRWLRFVRRSDLDRAKELISKSNKKHCIIPKDAKKIFTRYEGILKKWKETKYNVVDRTKKQSPFYGNGARSGVSSAPHSTLFLILRTTLRGYLSLLLYAPHIPNALRSSLY